MSAASDSYDRRKRFRRQRLQRALVTCNDSTYVGYTYWRVPTKEELIGIVKYSNGYVVEGDSHCSDRGSFTSPMVHLNFFPNFPNDWIWSSSSVEASSERATTIFCVSGFANPITKRDGLGALCVRDE